MNARTSAAERLDQAIDGLLAGRPTVSGSRAGELGPLVAIGAGLRQALPLPVPGARFEARLGMRLAEAGTLPDPLAWALRHPALLVTGAVGSAAVGVGLTALAVWRSGRRPAGMAHRFLQR